MSRNPSDSKACVTLRMFVGCIALGLLGAAATVTAKTPQTGASFSVKITGRQDDEGNQQPVTHRQVDHTIIVLKNRLKATGHLKSHISRKNGNGFQIRVDGVAADQLATIATILGKPGKLELKEVSPRKNFIIEGFQQPGEVQILANSLINPLEFPLVIEWERAVPNQKVAK